MLRSRDDKTVERLLNAKAGITFVVQHFNALFSNKLVDRSNCCVKDQTNCEAIDQPLPYNFGRVFDGPESMKKIRILFFLIHAIYAFQINAQEISLKKGIVIDSLESSAEESFAIYLPTAYEADSSWPLIVVCDLNGHGKRAVSMFMNAAEQYGFILAGSNNLNDTTSIANNILVTSRLLKKIKEMIPLEKERLYVAGFSSGARFASIVPSFIKEFRGVISLGAAIPNYELLTSRNSFHFIGVVGNEDFSYPDMLDARPVLKRLKYPNRLFVFDGGHKWPEAKWIDKSVAAINLRAMSKGPLVKDSVFIQNKYRQDLADLNTMLQAKDYIMAYDFLNEIIGQYQLHMNLDSLITRRKILRRNKDYRLQRRNENAALFKESLTREEFQFNLLEDISTLNYNNLGWWNFQVEELKKYEEKNSRAEQKMGLRLIDYLNALIEDNIDIELAEDPVNGEALSFLWMLKTITEPDNFEYYLKIISDSARFEDFGTSLFYLEELLKQGYKDKERLYSLEHTALLRITPEFNELIDQYLQDARYEIIEE